MYKLPYFQEEDPEVVKQFVRDHPFATVMGTDAENFPVATQVPVFIDEKDEKIYLSGHMMKNTDHHKAFMVNNMVLVLFTGAHTYVSATWYDNPHQASTWNYMSVHARGRIRFGGDEDLVNALRRLTSHYENNNNTTTVFDNLPDEYRQPLMKAIVPFEIEVDSLENVFKLSQNRNEKSYDNIIIELERRGGDGAIIASEMKKRRSQLFSS